MNRWTRVALLSFFALSAPWGAARAKDEAQGRGDRAQWREKVKSRLKEKLGLSEEEADKLEAAFKEKRQKDEPLRDRQRVSLEKLRWQVDAKADPKDIAATLAQIDEARKALRDSEDKFAANLSGILKPEQRARLLIIREDWRSRRGPRGMGANRGGRDGWGERPLGWRSPSGTNGRGERESDEDDDDDAHGPPPGRDGPPPDNETQ